MSRNHYHNHLAYGSLLSWLVMAAFLTVAGLSYLYLKNQLNLAGVERKHLERRLDELAEQTRVLDSQIAQLTSRTALQHRLKEGFIKLVDIPPGAVVKLPLLRERPAAPAVDPAAAAAAWSAPRPEVVRDEGTAGASPWRRVSHEP